MCNQVTISRVGVQRGDCLTCWCTNWRQLDVLVFNLVTAWRCKTWCQLEVLVYNLVTAWRVGVKPGDSLTCWCTTWWLLDVVGRRHKRHQLLLLSFLDQLHLKYEGDVQQDQDFFFFSIKIKECFLLSRIPWEPVNRTNGSIFYLGGRMLCRRRGCSRGRRSSPSRPRCSRTLPRSLGRCAMSGFPNLICNQQGHLRQDKGGTSCRTGASQTGQGHFRQDRGNSGRTKASQAGQGHFRQDKFISGRTGASQVGKGHLR